METTGYPAHKGGTMTEKLLHIVMTSCFESIFEVIRRGMSRKEAREYIRLLSRYHRTGFCLCTDKWRSAQKILCTGAESFAKDT